MVLLVVVGLTDESVVGKSADQVLFHSHTWWLSGCWRVSTSCTFSSSPASSGFLTTGWAGIQENEQTHARPLLFRLKIRAMSLLLPVGQSKYKASPDSRGEDRRYLESYSAKVHG